MSKMISGVHNYRGIGIYLYEKDGKKKATAFLDDGMTASFCGETYEEAYRMATAEIDRHVKMGREI